MEEYEGTTAVAITKTKKTTFQKGWDSFAEKTGFTTVFSKEFTTATAMTVTVTSNDTIADGAARKSSHCSRRVAISKSEAYSIARSPALHLSVVVVFNAYCRPAQ